MALSYPKTKKIDHVDIYHGIRVADPYRWLEDPNSDETKAWITAQNKVTRTYLDAIPARDSIHTRLSELWDYPKQQAPFKKGGRYFQLRNTGMQNQFVLYMMDSPTDEGRVLIDPNSFSEDGTVSMTMMQVSDDSRYIAYGLSSGGSDWRTWYVRDIETGQDLEDKLEWLKFSSVTWLPDSSGFVYQRYDAPNAGDDYTEKNSRLKMYVHTLGTAQTADRLIFDRPDKPEWLFGSTKSHDDRYLIMSISQSTAPKNLIFYTDLAAVTAKDRLEFIQLIPDFYAYFHFLGNDDSRFYFHTNHEADRFKVIAIDVDNPEQSQWQTIIPEQDDTLQTAKLMADTFLASYLHDAYSTLRRFTLEGSPLDVVDLPGIGTLTAPNVNRDDDEAFFLYTSFLQPSQSYRLRKGSNTLEPLSQAAINFDSDAFETRQVFATSKDGTRVSMFLTHKKGLELDGQNPTLLYGYGGFTVPLTPSFSVSRLLWLELGGVLAVTNLRGGGEYGKAWHEAGTQERKQNVFDDFIVCAEHLIRENITSTPKLAIQGGSNGGLLVGACMTQRPDLFGAALPAVGVLDMLRYHKFTIGWAWVGDYGSADDPEQFEFLRAYSPLHNLKEGTSYPATLVTTGDHDDRVVPAHSFKFAAALQKAHAGAQPALIRIQTDAGHGMGKPTKFIIDEQADIWAFLSKVLDIEVLL